MNETPPLRVLIADDEPLARQRLEDLLATEEGVEIADSVDNGEDAVEAIRRLEPDLVFLDVQMPGLSGLEVARAVGPEAMPVTILVTAYDEHAVQAFDLAALDYLVKPFDDERFHRALERARRVIGMEEVERMTRRLVSLIQSGDAPGEETSSTGDSGYLERIPVESRGKMRVVPVEKIDYITASGPYAELHVGDTTHLIRERMQTLEERLDPAEFFRIHRSAIVRLSLVDVLLRAGGGDYRVRLRSGVELSVSRGRREELERRMGGSR
jgi:two-component system, LytTR family, response regulator